MSSTTGWLSRCGNFSPLAILGSASVVFLVAAFDHAVQVEVSILLDKVHSVSATLAWVASAV